MFKRLCMHVRIYLYAYTYIYIHSHIRCLFVMLLPQLCLFQRGSADTITRTTADRDRQADCLVLLFARDSAFSTSAGMDTYQTPLMWAVSLAWIRCSGQYAASAHQAWRAGGCTQGRKSGLRL